MKLFELEKDVYVPNFQPVLFIKPENCIVASDLHLGIEKALEREGIFLPLNISLKVIENLEKIVETLNPERIIFLGDVKHEFGFPNPSEWISVKRMLEWFLNRKIKVDVVRGNHDNYLVAILKKYGVPLHQEFLILGEYSFTHGHLPVEVDNLKTTIFIGHEHPSIKIRDELGVSHKFKCFLKGEFKERRLIVLPSMNELAYGTDVNVVDKSEFLSPILRETDLGEFTPYPIYIGKSIEEFPKLKHFMF